MDDIWISLFFKQSGNIPFFFGELNFAYQMVVSMHKVGFLELWGWLL